MAETPPGRLDDRRILVLEDEFFIADDLARQLGDAGAEVIGPFATVDAAMAALDATEGVDLALLDLNLAGKLSYGIVDKLRERQIPVVLATGYDQRAIVETYRDIPRFQKPVSAPHLISTLSALLHA
ncbi:response regulator [Phenylobacterium sp. J426]|uniref:response regulator n=1 Tax=Phenylobacterium sp. J426 TaxID=2898439 RepID=UPI002150F8DF|nr:response regulator [Phenylobacterium sp. J426]MCR5874809.1 response regulator [Phenylobacterium sp. J426]